MREMWRQESLEDPRDYLHFVPWNELETIAWQTIESNTDIDDPFNDIFLGTRESGYMQWEIPSPAFRWMHHLRTEDEVLQYCIAKDWFLPGHSYTGKHGSILFGLTPIENNVFLKNLDQFWEFWVSPLK